MVYIILVSLLVGVAAASPLPKTLTVALRRHELSSNLSPIPIPLTNTPNAPFYGQISVGTPAQQFKVVFDSSTTNVWIPSSQCSDLSCLAHSRYDSSKSSSYTPVGNNFTDPTTNVTGFVSQDNFVLGSASISAQKFAEAVHVPFVPFVLAKYDGVLGLGYGTGTILDNLVASGAIAGRSYGLWLNRNSSSQGVGELSLGGPDVSRTTGPLLPIPVLENGARGWRVTIASLEVKGFAIGPFEAQLNSGTTAIRLPLDQADALNTALGGTVASTGKYSFDCSKLDKLPPVTFYLDQGDKDAVRADIQPSDYVLIYEFSSKFCLSAFEGVTFADDVKPYVVLGDAFLGAFYSYFDQDNNEFQLANKM